MASYKNKYFRFKTSGDFDIDQIVIPDTQMVKSRAYICSRLEAKSKAYLFYNHSWRTYFWGAAGTIYTKQQFDDGALLMTSLFHDIGLTSRATYS